MAITVEMPKLSDTMSEGRILSWKKKEGDSVSAGEILAEVESDKANMEMEAYDAGYVRKLLVAEGEAAPVGAPIAIMTEEPDEDIAEVLSRISEGAKPAPAKPAPDAGQAGPVAPQAEAAAAPPRSGAEPSAGKIAVATRVVASPLAARMAAEFGLDLAAIRGSGPGGRVVKRDVEAARAARGSAPAEARRAAAPFQAPPARVPAAGAIPAEAGGFEDVPLSMMRKAIATRLVESKVTAPHFYVTVEIDMKAAIAAREEVNRATEAGISFNDMIVKAVALALQRHPAVNASWQGESIRLHRSSDIGVAVSIPDGLIVPVVRAAHLKGLRQLSAEIRSLAERARDRKLDPEEYRGGTFTVSNMGMLGVTEFTAILNPPEACILAVGAIRDVPVVEAGAVVPGKRMSVTLSCDHRAVDGVAAARFLGDVRAFLESPFSLAL